MLPQHENGQDDSHTWDFVTPGLTENATLAAGDVYTVCHPAADAAILSNCDQHHAFLSDGNDAYALVMAADHNQIVDLIGHFGFAPPVGWAMAGVRAATADRTMQRKANIQRGNGGDFGSGAGTNAQNSHWVLHPLGTWWPAIERACECPLNATRGHCAGQPAPEPEPEPQPEPEPEPEPMTPIQITGSVSFPGDADSPLLDANSGERAAFVVEFRIVMAVALGVSAHDVAVDGITAGSVVVDFTIRAAGETGARAVLAAYEAQRAVGLTVGGMQTSEMAPASMQVRGLKQGLSSKHMAQTTSDCGAARSLSIKWP